jgi:hypothetical protein
MPDAMFTAVQVFQSASHILDTFDILCKFDFIHSHSLPRESGGKAGGPC